MLHLIWLSGKGSSDGELWWVEGMLFHIPFLPLLTGAYISPYTWQHVWWTSRRMKYTQVYFQKNFKKSHVIQFSAVYLKFSI